MNLKISHYRKFSILILCLLLGIGLLNRIDFRLWQDHARQATRFREQNEPAGDKTEAKFYPSDWAWQQRTFPFGTADKLAHVEALKQAQALRNDRRQLTKSGAATFARYRDAQWQFAGPENIGGRVSDIEFNPLDPNIVYAGAATGGVFKSEDGGWTWRPIFDAQAVLPIGDIAVDPVNPDIVFVGTGEANGGHNNFPGAGVYRSKDAGATWELLGLEATVSIGRIVIDPSQTHRVYLAAAGSYFGPDPDRGVYRSLDQGDTWQKVLFVSDSTGAIDLIIHPQKPELLLAAMWERVRTPHSSHLYGPTSGVYRSSDGGDTWTRLDVSSGLPANNSTIGRIGLAICQSQPDIVYALYTNYSGGGYSYYACYQSPDAGQNWFQVDLNRELSNGFSNFSWYFGNIRVHPQKPEIVYVLDVAFMRSLDHGASWPIVYGYGNPFEDFHVDHHALAFHPFHPDTLINGNDGGINISYDGGESWTKVAALPITQFYEITMDPTHPEKLYGGTQDNGSMRTPTGKTNDWEQILGGDGFFVVVDPTDSNTIYAETQNGSLYKSMDGGQSFFYARTGISSFEPTNWSTPVVMAPENHQVLYYGTNRVYRTSNGANSWQAISPIMSKQLTYSRLGTVTTIAVAPSDSNTIYAGTDDGNVWVTENYGRYWRLISNGLPFRWVTRVAVDPVDAAVAYVTFSGLKWKSPQPHVFRTEDKGATWQDLSANLPDAPVNAIVVDPLYPNNLYLGSDVGCFFTTNYGQSWDVLGQGLPVVPVYSLDIHKQLRYLVAGTHGRSMYSMDLAAIVPVELSLLEAQIQPSAIILTWRTESESNNWGFFVERRGKGSDFRSIGFVPGAGTTTTGQNYRFSDPDLPASQYFYRLRQVDYNQQFAFSNVLSITVATPGQYALEQNFPNPCNAQTQIRYRVQQTGPVQLTLYNSRGQQVRALVAAEKSPGSYQAFWDGKDDAGLTVASGIYYYEMKAFRFSERKRLVYLR